MWESFWSWFTDLAGSGVVDFIMALVAMVRAFLGW